MSWIWNDKNYFKREYTALKSTLKVGTPIATLVSLIWYGLIGDMVTLPEIIAIIVMTTVWVISIISFIYKLPNSYIHEDDSPKTQKQTRTIQMVGASVAMYFFVIGILHTYFPILKPLVCCDLMANIHF